MTAKKLLLAIPSIPLLGLAALVGRIYYQAHRPDVPEFPNQDPSGEFGDPSAPKLRVVVLGDSSVTAPGVDVEKAWVRHAARYLSDRYHVELVSVAVGGAKARDVLAEQVPLAIALDPDLAVVSVGANDSLRTPLLGRYQSELAQIVGAMHRKAAAVLVMGVGDAGQVPLLPDLVRGVLSYRAREADRRVIRVVGELPNAVRVETWGLLSEAFAEHGRDMWADDLFHLSELGHRSLYGEVETGLDSLAPLLG